MPFSGYHILLDHTLFRLLKESRTNSTSITSSTDSAVARLSVVRILLGSNSGPRDRLPSGPILFSGAAMSLVVLAGFIPKGTRNLVSVGGYYRN